MKKYRIKRPFAGRYGIVYQPSVDPVELDDATAALGGTRVEAVETEAPAAAPAPAPTLNAPGAISAPIVDREFRPRTNYRTKED